MAGLVCPGLPFSSDSQVEIGADGNSRIVRRGASGRILPIRSRIATTLERFASERKLRAHPNLWEAPMEQVQFWLGVAKPNVAKEKESETTRKKREKAEAAETEAAKRERAMTAVRFADWVRSQPRLTTEDEPCCDACPQLCSNRCETVPSCEGCGRYVGLPCKCPAECRPSRVVYKCWRCPRLGQSSPTEISSALEDYGEPKRAGETDEKAKLRLMLLERRLEVTYLLSTFGVDMPLPGADDQWDQAREDRLRELQMDIKCIMWFDGTPILNRSWTIHYWLFLYDPRKFALTSSALLECRRPREHIIVQACCG